MCLLFQSIWQGARAREDHLVYGVSAVTVLPGTGVGRTRMQSGLIRFLMQRGSGSQSESYDFLIDDARNELRGFPILRV